MLIGTMTHAAAKPQSQNVNDVLARWNEADALVAAREIFPCCGSVAWAQGMAARRPFVSEQELLITSDLVWEGLGEEDWREAFDSHPRIGEQHAKAATARSLAWSGDEQSAAVVADEKVKQELAAANREYEAKFGQIFLICASGRTASEVLANCRARMDHNAREEMLEAAEQQRQIMQLRLQRWLGGR